MKPTKQKAITETKAKPNVSGPYSQIVCSDCWQLGCLIPVKH